MSDGMAIIARAHCGCIKLAVAVERAHDCAKEIGECAADGMAIERMTAEQVRASDWRCAVCTPPKPVQATLLPAPVRAEGVTR